MMLGHALIAFSIVAAAATWKGLEKEKALALGTFAGLFAVLPDLDMILAFKALFLLFFSDIGSFVGTFWSISYEFHRGLSHSLVTGVLASMFFSLYYYRTSYLTGLTAVSAMTGFALIFAGPATAFVMVLFSVLGLAVTFYAKDFLDLRELAAVSLFGLMSHPFGDLFTGAPPEFLFPLNFILVESRMVLATDPVLNLLAVFGLEVVAAWSALMIFSHLRRIDLVSLIHPSISIGLLYISALFLFAPPTLDSPYRFVYSILGLGLVNSSIVGFLDIELDEKGVISLAVNLTMTVTVALICYTAGYLIF